MIDRRLVLLGAVLWLVAPFFGTIAFVSIEHVFLVLPLVGSPIALKVLGTAPLAQRAQPFAALALLASFALPKGPIAGALVVPWLLVALLVTASTLPKVRSSPARIRPSLVAISVFFPIGCVWLLLSRLGTGPQGIAPLTCFLAALHFHFSGFALQTILVGAGRTESSRLHRVAQIGAIAGIPLIAIGTLRALPPLKLLGVSLMVTSALLVAVLSIRVAKKSDCRIQRTFLFISSASVVTGMLLALVYGIAEIARIEIISIPHMVTTHGLLNGLGFTLCALAAYGRPANRGSSVDRLESATIACTRCT